MNRAGTFTFHPTGTLRQGFQYQFRWGDFPGSDTGTYSLDSNDCKFTATLPNAGETRNLIPVQEGQQIDFLVNPSPHIGAGMMSRQ